VFQPPIIRIKDMKFISLSRSYLVDKNIPFIRILILELLLNIICITYKIVRTYFIGLLDNIYNLNKDLIRNCRAFLVLNGSRADCQHK